MQTVLIHEDRHKQAKRHFLQLMQMCPKTKVIITEYLTCIKSRYKHTVDAVSQLFKKLPCILWNVKAHLSGLQGPTTSPHSELFDSSGNHKLKLAFIV
jgi:hypothetical protein